MLLAEALYPGRVTRGPLTDADRSLGYTAGRVIQLDTRVANSGRTVVEAVDFQFDWALQYLLGEDLQIYARATWQPSIRSQTARGQPWVERVGRVDGPLEWRGNAGVAWQRGRTSLELNIQYYDRYRLEYASTTLAADDARLQRNQGATHVPAQVYFDLAASRRFRIGGRDPLRSIEARLGILNLFDRNPRIVADPALLPYSPYGDPRGRRLELAVTANFNGDESSVECRSGSVLFRGVPIEHGASEA